MVAGEQVAVFRLRERHPPGRVGGLPPPGGPIADGQIDGRMVLCPLHLNAFDLTTGCSSTGAEPLSTYEVLVDGDQIIVVR